MTRQPWAMGNWVDALRAYHEGDKSMTRPARLRLYEVDGEDLIVATSLKEAQAVYHEYHGEPMRGRHVRLIPPDETVAMTNGDREFNMTASDVCCAQRGYIQAYR